MLTSDSVRFSEIPSLALNIAENSAVFNAAYDFEVNSFSARATIKNPGGALFFTSVYDQDETKQIKRADGETITVTVGRDGKATALALNAVKFSRNADGSWSSTDKSEVTIFTIKNVTVAADGAYTIDRQSKEDRTKTFSHTSKSDGTVVAKWFEKGIVVNELVVKPGE